MIAGIDTDFLVRASLPAHPGHGAAIQARDQHLQAENNFALAPQVVAEFVHVVTDARRFSEPVEMAEALLIGDFWWRSESVRQVSVAADGMVLFNAWMNEHKLGRNRILDTMLAATYTAAGIDHLITGNAKDFRIFNRFEFIEF